jgi:predicted nucleic acid-binding protein
MYSGEIFRFSDILRLRNVNSNLQKGCIVDTSILFAISYPNDAHNPVAVELFDYLSELQIPVHTNVNIRSEFIHNQLQVMIPEGLSDMYSKDGKSLHESIYKKLQSNYTTVSEARNKNLSYKFSNSKVVEWRDFFRKNITSGRDAWFNFCRDFISHRIQNVWEQTCNEVGVNFLSLRGSDTKNWLTGPVDWKDADALVGNYGIGSFDAMIINLFLNSHFPALVTADKEIARTVQDLKPEGKFVFVPDKLEL